MIRFRTTTLLSSSKVSPTNRVVTYRYPRSWAVVVNLFVYFQRRKNRNWESPAIQWNPRSSSQIPAIVQPIYRDPTEFDLTFKEINTPRVRSVCSHTQHHRKWRKTNTYTLGNTAAVERERERRYRWRWVEMEDDNRWRGSAVDDNNCVGFINEENNLPIWI